MDMMSIRRELMMMGNLSAIEIYTITTNQTIYATPNIDNYFSSRISGWDTEPILLLRLPSLPLPTVGNTIMLVASKYASDNNLLIGTSCYTYRLSDGAWVQRYKTGSYYANEILGDKYLVLRFLNV